ncbi:hypothetical protein AOQ84DRAFT_377493 [Glonium stellatum]|uniref:F-box domain-containing protein n=1 Tax=Glonium stellatum TaxID=574774 RepID=A0A8E2JS94_9PEZI|nr:hypothetical protein AOQ84DRAFT_377493 [Glonium stellatum]
MDPITVSPRPTRNDSKYCAVRSTYNLTPIEDWRSRIVGKRMTTTDTYKAVRSRYKFADFDKSATPRFFYCEPVPAKYDYMHTRSSRLLTLPAELRLQILEGALENTAKSAASVIFVCKQLYAEALLIALKSHTFKQSELPRPCRLHPFCWHNYSIGFPSVGEKECLTLNIVFDHRSVATEVFYGAYMIPCYHRQ